MRIVIVEDEIKIREGIGRLIESQSEHLVLGEAANGEEGLEMILRFKPDLVITDIQMPKMDGLEMLRYLHEHRISVHKVILSGYSEFEYAKKAIVYGVDDYLLKPLSIDDAEEMLRKIEQRIKEEQLTKGMPDIYLKNFIVDKENEAEKNLEILENIYGFSKEKLSLFIVGYLGSMPSSYQEQLELFLKEIKEESQLKICWAYLENKQMVYILAQEGKEIDGLSKLEKKCFQRLILQYQKREEKPVWTRESFYGLVDLKKIALELEQQISNVLVLSYEGWLTKELLKNYQSIPFQAPTEISNHIRNAICREDWERLKMESENFLNYMKEHSFEAGDVKQAFVKNYYLIIDTLQDFDANIYRHLKNANLLRNVESAITWSELEYAYRAVIQMITGAKVKREDISNYVIKKAINYIREHYQEGITQEEVSRELEITPEYLSTLFNREMSINFSTFLKQFRISHAKRLLKGTDMKIYEIAQAVGYNDSKYFQRVFKEELGISPGEYRQMR